MSSQFKKNIKIVLEYNNRTVASLMKPYDKMIEIRKLAKKVFYPLKEDISLTYQNQDLCDFDSYLIGDYFNQKTLAKIKVVPKIIKRELRITDKSIEGNDPKKKILSCLCGKYYISNYCRTCKQYICNHCKSKKEHESHKTVSVNTNNLIDSIKIYAMSLKEEITLNIENSKKYYEKFQSSKFIEASSWKEIIQRKYEQFYDKYQSYLNLYKVPDDSEEKINEFLSESKNDKNEINNLINQIIQDSKKLGYKMNLDEFKDYYDKLSQIDDKIIKISKNTTIFIKNYELNEKFDYINKEIEKILDLALDDHNFIGYDKPLENEDDNNQNNNEVNNGEKDSFNNEEVENENNENNENENSGENNQNENENENENLSESNNEDNNKNEEKESQKVNYIEMVEREDIDLK